VSYGGDRRTMPYARATNAAIDLIDTLGDPHKQMRAGSVYLRLIRAASAARDGWHDNGFVVTRKALAEKSGMTTKTFDRAIEDLVGLGLVQIEKRYDENRSQLANKYWLVDAPSESVQQAPISTPGSTDSLGEGEQTTQLLVTEQELQQTPLGGGETSSSKPVRFDGKVVPHKMVLDAEYLLQVLSKRANRDYLAYDRDGRPSAALKPILGWFLKANPPLTREEGEQMIRRTSHDPWWNDGAKINPGHVFGPKSFLMQRAKHGNIRSRA